MIILHTDHADDEYVDDDDDDDDDATVDDHDDVFNIAADCAVHVRSCECECFAG